MASTWHAADLSAATGAPAAVGDPDGYMFDAQGTQHAVYRGSDNHIHELWWSDPGGWHASDLTGVSGAPNAAGDPTGYMFDAQGTQHVVYRSGDGHIRELWWDPSGWHAADLTATTGAAIAVGDPAGYMFDAQGTQHVVYRSGDGHIRELWWNPSGWHAEDLTATTGAAIAVGDPAGYMFDAQGTQHVVYRSGDGHMRELWWNPSGWHAEDLTATTGAAIAVGDPAGYMFDAQGTQHVVYRSGDGHMRELWWDPSGWHAADLTAATAAVNAAGDPAGYMFDAQGTQHVVYRSGDGHMRELWWEPSGWHAADLSAVSSAPNAVGDPAAYMFTAQGTQHVLYRSGDSHIRELWWGDSGTAPHYVRREIWGLESAAAFDPISLAYARAVKVMQARPATDPTSWAYQAGIHGAYAAPPPGATWNACQHQGWFFLPWHRMYLYFFERIVRKAVLDAGGPADFALPYWNYDRPFPANTLPPAFRAATLPDGSANPLFIAAPRRSAALMSGGQVPSTATSPAAALANQDFSLASFQPTFGGGRVGPAHFGGATGLLEQTPHNVMHPTIGGSIVGQCAGAFMSDPDCAALDPIFWLHHANIDRLWNVWLRSGGTRANPSEAAWLTASFVFRDENGAQVTMTGAQVVDSAAQLGYTYDDVPVPALAAMDEELARQRPAPRPPELAGASDTRLELTGGPVSISLAMPDASVGLVRDAASDAARQLFVSVEDIEADQDPGLAYALYIEGAEGQRQHIGNVSVFGIQHANDPDRPHDGAPGLRHTFDATAAMSALSRQDDFDPKSITVTFEPIRILPPPGETFPSGIEDTGPTPPIRIGRVGLFVS